MTQHPALGLACAVGERLVDPDAVPGGLRGAGWWRQSLAHGLPGIALLHIELAASGRGPWQRAHDWLAAIAQAPLTAGTDSNPYYGAPALAHALACAAGQLPGGAYRRALEALDRQVAAEARRRAAAAHRRIDHQELPALAEFDAVRGLSGYGAYLLRRDADGDALRAVLDYLVRLASPLTLHGEVLPGWWTPSGPSGRPDNRLPGGHANSGMAHGITGPLSLLSLAARRGTTVTGQLDAIRTICTWLERWRTDTTNGPEWPYWITRAELRNGRRVSTGALRPSWCYGTAGLARAQQLAALALGDTGRQVEAENALVDALTDPAQLKATTDNSLCHGFAGLAHIAARTADDAHPTTAGQLRAVIPALLAALCPPGTDPADAATTIVQDEEAGPGFLNGAAGIALALLSPATATPPRSAWDTCLLIA
ncbi:lanthionine synthetase C family protein [Streptomyces sp. QH1-20]|uniref:lanthionine synthetase C family protein n=1 Tax=Streptomyces sp. QH1-20 TaxID=3240934 RepID=UPI003511522A